MSRIFFALAFASTIGCGIVAGIFYAFSSFVMPALGRLPAEQGVSAMNQINVTVITPSFMLVFLGTAVLSLLLAGASLFYWASPGARLAFGGGVLYLVGCFGVTMAFNVPLNDRLAAVEPAQVPTLWAHYLDAWTKWNTVRTIAPVLSMVALLLALTKA